jgi:GNAT superfamily N-acetyltransferase
VTIEIRPVKPAEVRAYLRVMPYANGLPHWEPAPAAWHGGTEAWPQPADPASEEQLDRWAERVLGEGFFPQAAFVDGRVVGGSAMLAMDITVPGPRPVPLGGVTATAAAATHRRRGLLRGMMQAMFDEARARGEAIAGLSASEGGIYGRYGFSPATRRTRWELDRASAALVPAEPPAGELELVDAAAARDASPRVHERVRRDRVGELSPQPGRWDGLSDAPSGTAGPMRYLVHRDPSGDVDGIAQFRLPWATRLEDTGRLVVEALEAVTPDAYRALWGLLTDFDLTRTVVAPARPADEPLRWMLANPRRRPDPRAPRGRRRRPRPGPAHGPGAVQRLRVLTGPWHESGRGAQRSGGTVAAWTNPTPTIPTREPRTTTAPISSTTS